MNDESILIGTHETWAETVPFGISLPDLRQHVYVIGKTGSGKTTLLRNMILQHIALGHGVGLIDPHGDLAEELLNHIPRWRTDHLVYFDPSDLEFPIALNLLANVPKDQRHLVASGIVGAFKSIWPDSWGPRMEYILYNAIAALLDCQNTSLLHQHGYRNVVALMGGSMSPSQEGLIRKHTSSNSRVVVMLDEDEAGQAAREEIAGRLAKFCFAKVHVFEEPGTQPEHLTADEVHQLFL